jgi:hypothetical protein
LRSRRFAQPAPRGNALATIAAELDDSRFVRMQR